MKRIVPEESEKYLMVKHVVNSEEEAQMWADGMSTVASDTELGVLRYFAIKQPNGKYDCYCFYDNHHFKGVEEDKRGFRVLCFHNIA